MRAPISRSSAALLAIGTVVILALAAFSPFNSRAPVAPMTAAILAPAIESAPEPAKEPQAPANLSPGLSEVVKLAQNHVDEAVILEYIRNSGLAYSPTADELLYLKDLGMSARVLAALFKDKPTVAPTLPAPALAASESAFPPPAPGPVPDASIDNFHKALDPYGSWLQVPNYGLCWQPTAETINPDWRPYVDDGQWQYTDNGWYWLSGYTWGAIAFHYGRWTQTAQAGWVWAPDTTWGPAWVSWRIALDYSGWAPLPPGVGLAVGAGLTFYNQRVAADYDFGIPAGWYTFVSPDNFLDPNLAAYAVQAGSAGSIYQRSTTVNNYSSVNHKIVNQGPGLAEIAGAPAMNPPRTDAKPPPSRRKWEEPARVVVDSLTGQDMEAPADPPLTRPKPGPVTSGWSPWLTRDDLAMATPTQTELAPAPPQKIHHHHPWAENRNPSGWENAAAVDRPAPEARFEPGRFEPAQQPANHESARREWSPAPEFGHMAAAPPPAEAPRAAAPVYAAPAVPSGASRSGR